MVINIQDDILRLNAMGMLTRLLQDKATKGSILWATNAYCQMGDGYEPGNRILPQRITGENSDLIKTRARRAMEQRTERTRQHAEVFTPRWVVSKMNDFCDQQWFGRKDGIYKTTDDGKIYFSKHKHWKLYVDAKRMEITCGEAPFLCSRYDVETGEAIPVEERIGLLDRKLRVVSQQAQDRDEWQLWAMRAVQSVYGYELQGDNLLIARVNILCTVEEHLYARWREKPEKGWLEKLCNVIAWNLWQMDGLSGCVPVPPLSTEEQLSLFPSPQTEMNLFGETEQERIPCRLFDWRGAHSISYKTLREEGKKVMKFDFIIGNPAYQEEAEGTSDKPIYNFFMDEAFKIADKVAVITPARFLFNAGKTPKAWNNKMLHDKHFKVIFYEQDSNKVFLGKRIPGGIAITYRDNNQIFGGIEVFSHYHQLRSITTKMRCYTSDNNNLVKIMHLQNRLNLDELYKHYPETKEVVSSGGRERRIVSSAFDKLPIFLDQEPKSKEPYVQVFGLEGTGNKRRIKYAFAKYIENNGNLFKWKVMVSKSNGGAGNICDEPVRIIKEPFILRPTIGYTQSFIGIGAFDSEEEAINASSYLKTKFVRCVLGILKMTQDNPPDRWKYVPLQDFTPASDIDWSKSIPEIDQQLYAKYGLDESEIAFIESHVKEMS